MFEFAFSCMDFARSTALGRRCHVHFGSCGVFGWRSATGFIPALYSTGSVFIWTTLQHSLTQGGHGLIGSLHRLRVGVHFELGMARWRFIDGNSLSGWLASPTRAAHIKCVWLCHNFGFSLSVQLVVAVG